MVVDVVYNPLLQLQEWGLERLNNLLHGTWEKVVKPELDLGSWALEPAQRTGSDLFSGRLLPSCPGFSSMN